MKLTNLTNSRTLGTCYLVFAILSGIAGVVLSLLIRFAWSSPAIDGLPLLSLITSSHALVMICFMMIPALFGGFANWLTPMMIGTDDMQFKRLNLLAFCLLPIGFVLLLGNVFLTSSFFIFIVVLIATLHIIALSFLLSAINFIATILAARPYNMGFAKMGSFIWSLLIASFLMVVSLPVISAALTVELGKLAVSGGGGTQILAPIHPPLPIMLWFFTHPELFILLLPSFGIISEIIATFTKGRLAGAKIVHGAMLAMGAAGLYLWCSHILSDSILPNGILSSKATTNLQGYFFNLLIGLGLPAMLILAAWLVNLWQGLRHKAGYISTPVLWSIGFICIMLVAALSAISLHLSIPNNLGSGIAHFHYILSLSGVFAIFAGWYFWFGKVTGYQISETVGKLHFWCFFISVHLTFLPQHFGAMIHLPGSWGAQIDSLIGWQQIATLGACLSALSLLLFFYAIVQAFVRKCAVGANPWSQSASGLEWQLSSPPQIKYGQMIALPLPLPSPIVNTRKNLAR